MSTSLPPAPQRDLLWELARTTAPDVGDFVTRHRRGRVLLPYTAHIGPAGAPVDAWVCCDPVCGGVEVSEYLLELDHGCCPPTYFQPGWYVESRMAQARRHMAGFGTVHFRGYSHGPLTAWWEPEQSGLLAHI
ncbi:hypothetical protein [Actinoplanes sp. NBRC 101535]|uniref:hypothetical protein n=1 Tax=Actinoplanes sp. NBRC 101535 TaxID=3032196 RepID=UPI0024A56DA6|nr:hypothetical protein [Actinoplanes sp. NBRC 101535]GLY08330.1 hypothetical protein Acsp01_87090 [Actinoplanes sp. NBRC 101535]